MTRLARFLTQFLLIGCLLGQPALALAQDEPLDPLTVAPLPSVLALEGPVDDDSVGGQALTQEMDSLLVELLMHASSDDLSPEAREDLTNAGIILDGDRVQVQITIDPVDRQAVTDLVSALGGVISGASLVEDRLQGWAPILALADLAQHPLVHYVRHPLPLVLADDPRGVVSSEALSVFNVAGWQQRGRDGGGVHVAIIDGGFAGYRNLLGVELPATVNAVNFVDNGEADAIEGSSAHGTAVAEIVYDVAPGAEFSLLRINTNIDLSEAVHWAIRHNVDVIASSIGWYNMGPGDGTGELSDLVALADQSGILWVTSAGNDRERHWAGLYRDNDGDTRHEYAPYSEVQIFGPQADHSYLIPAGYPIVLHLRWSDWSTVDLDFNLALMRFDGAEWQTVARSQNVQNGQRGQAPTENIFYTTSGAAAAYGVVITHRSGVIDRPVNFDLYAPRSLSFNRPVYERSITDLGDAPHAITVGAIDAAGAYLPESYSAEGPTNGPGGTQDGGFLKPDLIAYTNVTIASTDYPFNGTSAATPHVAGAAVLVKDAYPDWSPAQIRQFLYDRAQPVPAGIDIVETRTGRGRLDLGAPPSQLHGSRLSLTLAENGEGAAQVYTKIQIVNTSSLTVTANLAHSLPEGISAWDTPAATSAPQPQWIGDELTWQGEIPAESVIAVSYTASVTAALDQPLRLFGVAILTQDDETTPLSALLNPLETFLPFLRKR